MACQGSCGLHGQHARAGSLLSVLAVVVPLLGRRRGDRAGEPVAVPLQRLVDADRLPIRPRAGDIQSEDQREFVRIETSGWRMPPYSRRRSVTSVEFTGWSITFPSAFGFCPGVLRCKRWRRPALPAHGVDASGGPELQEAANKARVTSSVPRVIVLAGVRSIVTFYTWALAMLLGLKLRPHREPAASR